MASATVTIKRSSTVGHVGQGFAGLSFEKTHVTNGSLTGQNAAMIALFRLLGPSVVRLGGDDADKETWAPTAMPGGGAAPFPTTVGTADVDALSAFLGATGWRAIYGVNFKTGTPANSAAEAAYVATKLGSSLYGIEIGNEINFSGTWASIKSKWEGFATQLLSAAPTAKIIGPAAAGSGVPVFLDAFTTDEASRLLLLTAHYYRAPANTNQATLANLSTADSALITRLTDVGTAATMNHIPDGYRFGECNTFSQHGQDGLSNALISALWSLDFMFTNAINGSSGVNFHGGQTGSDASLPTTPFYYAPIQEDNGKVTAAAPLFYGMLFFTLAGTGDVLATTATASNSANLSAYTLAQADGSLNIILDNKEPATSVTASVDVGANVAAAAAIYLQGPSPVSLTATSGVTVAGAPIDASGGWTPKAPYTLQSSGHVATVVVPPGSAALVHVR